MSSPISRRLSLATGTTRSTRARNGGARADAGLLSILIAAQLFSWITHYLTWPWYTDHDVFGTLAFAWDKVSCPTAT